MTRRCICCLELELNAKDWRITLDNDDDGDNGYDDGDDDDDGDGDNDGDGDDGWGPLLTPGGGWT